VSGPTWQVTGDGGVFFSKGTSTSLPATVNSGAGLLWYAPKNSLIISNNFAATPSPTGVGENTVSIFSKAVPTGANAIAIGDYTSSPSTPYTASGAGSIVINGGYATNTKSIAVNGGTGSGQQAVSIGGIASGSWSFAGGSSYSTASGSRSIAYGEFAFGTGSFAVALGGSPTASGSGAVALGSGVASGSGAFAANSGNAPGSRAAAFGEYSTAQAYDSFAIGRYNALEGDPLTWQATDPLFVVGNGTASNARKNAFVIYKDGKIKMNRQGDIPMGEFGNGGGD